MRLKVLRYGKGVYATDKGVFLLVDDVGHGVLQNRDTGEIHDIVSVKRDSKEKVLEIDVEGGD